MRPPQPCRNHKDRALRELVARHVKSRWWTRQQLSVQQNTKDIQPPSRLHWKQRNWIPKRCELDKIHHPQLLDHLLRISTYQLDLQLKCSAPPASSNWMQHSWEKPQSAVLQNTDGVNADLHLLQRKSRVHRSPVHIPLPSREPQELSEETGISPKDHPENH